MNWHHATAGLLSLAAMATPAYAATDCRLGERVTLEQASGTLCHFDNRTRRFAGSALEQANCLTRHVGIGAKIGKPEFPAGLAALVGKPTAIDPNRLQAYLAGRSLGPRQIGGDVTSPLGATYFIIHDTSTPNCSEAAEIKSSCPIFDQMPSNRDDATWAVNTTFGGRPKTAPHREANVYVNRVGDSVTEANFDDTSLGTTKFEYCQIGEANFGDFVGVENIQPRLSAESRPFKPLPPKKHRNDSIAPLPGFSDTQYDRLALLYVVASSRHKSWMVPAYHAVIDHYFRDQHDDPQNFEISKFDTAVNRLVAHLTTGS